MIVLYRFHIIVLSLHIYKQGITLIEIVSRLSTSPFLTVFLFSLLYAPSINPVICKYLDRGWGKALILRESILYCRSRNPVSCKLKTSMQDFYAQKYKILLWKKSCIKDFKWGSSVVNSVPKIYISEIYKTYIEDESVLWLTWRYLKTWKFLQCML